ncbi:MAG: LLM class F420-dependent oxidoreductase [Dehalococcoidia bacterium]|nr:LLM class F420-dependent oxidoreductase [Dehalococcoidia bacterium]MDZ4278666.1 LLM class F420-dependent oxidoreductase [Dehalococcoidia bacterium]
MRLGFFLPQLGPAASPESIVRVAKRAEDLGYDSVWVTERLLFPIAPQTPYAGTPDGSLPDVYKISFDPIETLTYVAARTQRIALGTSVLVMPYYNPVVLARRLTTLDVLSGGRLRVGLGLGWSKDEHDATGASMKGRGRLADEFLDVLKAIWTADPVEFKGKFFQVPKSIIQPKPVQQPHPPVYLAAFTPRGLKRAATKANGWHPVGMPVEAMQQMAGGMRAMAKEAGRDPNELEIVVRANFLLSPEPLGDDRFIYMGSEDQLKQDIKATRDLGADELIFDPTFSPAGESLDGFLSSLEKIKGLAA